MAAGLWRRRVWANVGRRLSKIRKAAHRDALRDAEQKWAGIDEPPSLLVTADEKVTPKKA